MFSESGVQTSICINLYYFYQLNIKLNEWLSIIYCRLSKLFKALKTTVYHHRTEDCTAVFGGGASRGVRLFFKMCVCQKKANLDALLELVSRGGRSFPEQLTEDDDLLEEENSSFFGARQDAGVLLRHKEGFLLQQFALRGQFTLQRRFYQSAPLILSNCYQSYTGGGCTEMYSKWTHLVSLQPTQIHHVVTQFRDLRHQIYCFL